MEKEPQSEIIIDYNFPIPTRDGICLYANVYRPNTNKKYPVLLTRTPYGKENLQLIIDPLNAVRSGYIVVVQDVRGRFCSEGQFIPFINEINDGYDTIEYISSTSWSNGNIGMFGISYCGLTQWYAAMSKPPHLKTIIPFESEPNLYELIFGNGIFKPGLLITYALLLSADTVIKNHGSLPELWIEAVDKIDDWFKNIPDEGIDFLKNNASFYFDWLCNSYEDNKYKVKLREINRITELNLPVLCVGGWYDMFAKNTVEAIKLLIKTNTKTTRLIMGPWDHIFPLSNMVGSENFGFKNSYALSGFETLIMKWFDRYLKNIENEIEKEKPIQLFDLGSKKWFEFENWPENPGKKELFMHYRKSSHGNIKPYMLIGKKLTSTDNKLDILFDPADPVPSLGGLPCFMPDGKICNQGAFDQRILEQRKDVISFTSEKLKNQLVILGLVKVVIYASTRDADFDIHLKFINVYPDGRAINIMESATRKSFVENLNNIKILTREIYKYEIDLSYTYIKIEKDHRLKLDVACSNFPNYEIVKNINSDNGYFISKKSVNTIYVNENYPSRIILPIIN